MRKKASTEIGERFGVHPFFPFGNVEPIVWNRSTGNVIGGHQRLRVLLDLKVTESEVSVVDLSEVDEKWLNIALNKITGEWDDEKLTSLLAEITRYAESTGDADSIHVLRDEEHILYTALVKEVGADG